MAKVIINIEGSESNLKVTGGVRDWDMFKAMVGQTIAVLDTIIHKHKCTQEGCHLVKLSTEVKASIHAAINLHTLEDGQ